MPEIDTYSWVGTFEDLNPDDRASVAQLVVRGRAVVGTVGQIGSRLENAQVIALLREKGTGRILGSAALKNPAPQYRLHTFAEAGVAIAGYEDAPELGYVVVAEDMRGKQLSGYLVDLIAKAISEPAFATTDSDTMKNNLARSGFSRVGREWPGQKGMLSLWTLNPR